MIIWIKFTHYSPFLFTDSWNVDVHSHHLLFDHFQFALIHGPNIPDSYAVLFFQHRFISITSTSVHCFCFVSVSSFFLELFLHSSLVAYWAPTDLGSLSFSVIRFCLFILFITHRTKHWANTKGELAISLPSLLHIEAESGLPQPKPEGVMLLLSQPQRWHLPTNYEQAPAANHVSLRSWMVDIHQEGCSLRSALQRRHMAHLRQCSCSAPGKPSIQDWGGD